MVGRRDAGLAVARELGAVDVIEHRRAGAEVDDETLVGAGFAATAMAQAPRRIGATSAALASAAGSGGRRTPCCGRARSRSSAWRHQLDHALIGFARGVAEAEDAVLQQHQPFDRGSALEDLGRFLGQRKPGMM